MTSTLPVPPMVSPPDEHAPPPVPGAPRSRARSLLRGPAADPAWVRPALLGLLLATGVLYLWGLGASGWGNSFYSAAVQAATQSWKAFFFGSSDAGNSITVDKTPASLWVMALSARVFGVNAWSILVPQALMGVASVGLLFATLRRWYGPVAGLLGGAVLALTPIATLMFRFNNPDALLVLLMMAGAYAVVRALETGATKWLVLAGVFVGFGFLTKMLQALLVVPAFGLAYLVAGPPRLGRRVGQLLLAGLSVVVSAGWYIAIVDLVPASMRPYIGGSQDNSLLELTLGYNGLGRLNGEETGSVGGGRGWGTPGWGRMFDAEQGGQVSWLLPAALVLLVAALVVTARRPRTDRARAGLLLWGGWLLITGVTFSLMQGIFHAYYTVALAPAVGAVVGIGVAVLWPLRRHPAVALTLAGTVALSAWWAFTLLGRSTDFLPWLRWTVLVAGLLAAAGLLASLRLPARVAVLSAGFALAAVLAGPAAYAVDTASEPHTGAIPSAGPATAGGFGPGGRGGFPGGGQRRFPGGGTGQPGGVPGALPNGFGGQTGGQATVPGTVTPPTGGFPAGGMRRGGMGNLLDSPTPPAQVTALLKADADSYTWTAAAIGSTNASGYQLAAGAAVMPVGGFNGTDPSPTLAQFQQYVAAGKIHYFIGGGAMGGGRMGGAAMGGAAMGGAAMGGAAMGGSADSSQISAWVTATYTAQTVGGVTLYDLTAAG